MGKDNVAFHSVSFPVTLLGSEEPWKTVDVLKAFNWLNWYGGKFSTSQRRGVFMDAALELLPAGLLALAPDRECAGRLGQRLHLGAVPGGGEQGPGRRLRQFREPHPQVRGDPFEASCPRGARPASANAALRGHRAGIAELTAQMEAIELRKSAQALRALWVLGNEYLTEAAPWTAIKTDRDRAAVVVRTGLNLVALFAVISRPSCPSPPRSSPAARRGGRRLARCGRGRALRPAAGAWRSGAEVLFRKIEDAQVANGPPLRRPEAHACQGVEA
jgi:methionyl-tRNA synthetase